MTPAGAPLQPGRRACLRVAVALGTSAAGGWISLPAAANEAPPELATGLPGARLSGEGRFRYFGLHIYDARLWRPSGSSGTAEVGAQPLALELIYARALSGQAIAERSLEEMRRVGSVPAEQGQAWLNAMRAAFPDVRAGDRLLGLYQPGAAVRFFLNGQPTREVGDAEFGRLFFGIWLSPRTSAPDLRRALLGLPGG
jgi:hypothetical protein